MKWKRIKHGTLGKDIWEMGKKPKRDKDGKDASDKK